jgi:hypothetical protein
MKSLLTLLVMFGLISAASGARAPSGTFTAGEYEEAKKKAVETDKPIAIVITELESSCPKCQAGNEAVFRQMKADYVLVVDDPKADGKLPEKVKQNTYPIYKTKGNVIPIVAVLSPKTDQLLGGLCYKQISGDGRNAFKTLKQEITAKMDEAAAPAPTPAAEASAAKSVVREWTNAEGVTIKAEALSSNGTHVTFKLESGKVVDYPLEKLSKESRELVREFFPSTAVRP